MTSPFSLHVLLMKLCEHSKIVMEIIHVFPVLTQPISENLIIFIFLSVVYVSVCVHEHTVGRVHYVMINDVR